MQYAAYYIYSAYIPVCLVACMCSMIYVRVCMCVCLRYLPRSKYAGISPISPPVQCVYVCVCMFPHICLSTVSFVHDVEADQSQNLRLGIS